MNDVKDNFETARETALKMISVLKDEENIGSKMHNALPFIIMAIIKQVYDVYEAREYMDNLKSVILDFYNAKK